jgi:fluoroquinolone resistance protein
MDETMDRLAADQIEDEEFSGLRLAEADLRGKSFVSCRFLQCDFSAADFSGALVADCSFVGCNLSLVKIKNARWQGVALRECKIAGVNFASLSELLSDFSFADCLLQSCIFSGMSQKKQSFRKCQVRDCDFHRTDLREADFSDAVLTGSLFEQCNLSKADFGTATGYTINPLNNTLKGARFSLPEAMTLLSALGIRVV